MHHFKEFLGIDLRIWLILEFKFQALNSKSETSSNYQNPTAERDDSLYKNKKIQKIYGTV